ncbi:MAG: cysteine dioxygenase family protein [Bdellovibrionaceae bacterium]|nr:cysteine dioxygenase family protein [Bdellovibrio sp.]
MEEPMLTELTGQGWMQILSQSFTTPAELPFVLSKRSLSVEKLVRLAQTSACDDEPYGRKILFKSPEIEVMLAKWSYQASASPHNHGFSKGLIWFVQGDFSERHFIFSEGELKSSGEPVQFKEGSVAQVVSNDIHSCCPVKDGVSLHIYSPAIQKMKVWDLKNRETLTVADECGAWIPKDLKLIANRVKWN